MFIGRKDELSSLRAEIQSDRACLAVVYGRRRVGKSFLIAEAARGARFYSFEGLENQSSLAQRRIFKEQLANYGVAVDEDGVPSWYKLLSKLQALISSDEPTVILLDELQWLANYRSELISNLKLVWDQILSKNSRVKLILCGSVASFMVRKVIRSKALYGRSNLAIHLLPFKLAETRDMFPDKSLEEVVLAQLFVGGVPKYLNLLSDKSSVLLSLAFHCRGRNAYFFDEFTKIFVSHFGNDNTYERLVRYLNGKTNGATREEICSALDISNSGQLSEILENLEFGGLITSFVPFNKNTNSKLRLFVLSDHFIKFYLTFLEPIKLKGQIEKFDFLNDIFHTPKMASFLGSCFELLCLNHKHEIARALEFSGIRYRAGPFFRRNSGKKAGEKRGGDEGVQLDLVFQREDKVVTVCEIKYQVEPAGLDVAKKLNQAIAKIPELKSKTIQKVLITNEAAAKTVQAGIHFSRVLSSEDLLGVRG